MGESGDQSRGEGTVKMKEVSEVPLYVVFETDPLEFPKDICTGNWPPLELCTVTLTRPQLVDEPNVRLQN